jgi:hypothetical protein
MKTLYLIYIICIKLFLLFLFLCLLLEKVYHQIDGNDLEFYFSQSICKLLYFTLNYNCPMSFFKNADFYNDILEINSDINLLMNNKRDKLENIFLLLSIIPFLKNNSTLTYKINNKGIYKFLKMILKNKIKYKVIKLDYNDFLSFNTKMKKLLYYMWELIPKQFMLDNFRYIINNYYKESNLKAFEESLNMNYKSYIQNKIKEITFEEIKNLLSKFYY